MESDRQLSAARRLTAAVFGAAQAREFDVRYWNGDIERAGRPPRKFTLVIRAPSALRQMLLPPSELAIVETLIAGDIDIEGDWEQAATLADQIGTRVRSVRAVAALVPLLLQLPAPRRDVPRALRFAGPADRKRERGTAAIRHHYDVGNEFYALWLDGDMQYSCGYFRSPDATLDQAQTDKLDHICGKLRLKPGERLLDIGCGWGGLLRHAASRYGVTAEGITLSAAQAEYARARIAREGLEHSCSVRVQDYRDLSDESRYDKIVSVGMAEHVRDRDQPLYFGAASRALKPGGLFLNHCIVTVGETRPRTLRQRIGDRLWRRRAFIERYVFPEGRLLPAAFLIACAERSGFELRDVESLREHYALTLRHWVQRLASGRDEAVALVGERRYRVWKLYMSASAHGFASGRINVIQTLLSKPDAAGRSHLPLTREDLYAPDTTSAGPRRLPAA